jgi:hypothetical protein
MKKSKIPKKKPTHAKRAASAASVHRSAPSATKKRPLVSTQPRSKRDAAVQAGMFLYTDDNWSLAYFNDGDLHCMERELFG